jgi:cell division protein FtsQ
MADPGSRRWRLVRARTDAVPASVRRFNQRAQQRRIRAARPWLVGAAALALAALVAFLVYGTPLLGVRHVEVRGTMLLDADQVRDAAAVPAGTPLASLDLAAVQRRVAALTPVRRATVTRDWPSTVVIEVTERVGFATLLRPDQRFDVMDEAGVVFRTVPADPGLPAVKLPAPGPADPTTRAAVEVITALTPELRDQLATLVADSPARIRLDLHGGRQIIWGDSSENAAKAKVATVLLGRPGAVINVSAPQFATVH